MSRQHRKDDELTCKPLDTYEEVMLFSEYPPPWRTLCNELTPHSAFMLKNMEINSHYDAFLDLPQTFCHFDPETEDVIRHDEKTLPRTLVCHDMANGYHDDSYIDGTSNHEAYTFYNWAGIDIFCYFSHHLVTIPPLGWINVGHAHGVKVIGTLISEWSDGIAFWDKVLQSEQHYTNFATALVTITKTLKFDGWLLNVENKIAKPNDLLNFIRFFNNALHQALPHAVLIWYDSVTIQGSLNWQNGLNDKNRPFFDACDGLFTNYSWSESDLEESAMYAGDRVHDLYIGIDVWGRNFFGGGQFNTQSAVKVAYQRGCSLAVFAPAWTHEAMTTKKGDINTVAMSEGLESGQRFLLRDRALWGSMWPFLNTRVPCAMPFRTSFCKGLGKKRRIYGEVLCNSPWFNLRHQQYQPNSAHGPHAYLLSTYEVILKHSKHTAKDGKGILRYAPSFQMSRMELLSTRSILKDITMTPVDGEDMDEDDFIEDVPKKRKVMNYFLQLLQRKSQRTESQLVEHTDPEERAKSAERAESPERAESAERAESPERAESAERAESPEHAESPERVESAEHTESPEHASEPGPSILRVPDMKRYRKGKSMLQMSVSLNLGKKGKPQRYGLAYVPEERECLEAYQEDSFIGGSCLCINPTDVLCPEHRMTRLFHCDFHCEGSLIVCVVTKKLYGFLEQRLNVIMIAKNVSDENVRIVLIGRKVPQTDRQLDSHSTGNVNVYPLDIAGARFRDVQKYILLNQSSFYVPVENSFNWRVRYYEVSLPGCRVSSINLRTSLEQGPILLGHFGICHRPQDQTENEVNASSGE